MAMQAEDRRIEMSDERPQNNTNPGTNPDAHEAGPQPPESDWRDRRREWREERRERRYHDPLRGLFWGLVLVLVGVLLFINLQSGVEWDILWKYLLIGLGAIFLIDGLAHYWKPAYRPGSFGRFIPGIILLFVGIAFLFDFTQWWPIVLIAVGVAILLSLLFRRRTPD
jgi:hypothetical protein